MKLIFQILILVFMAATAKQLPSKQRCCTKEKWEPFKALKKERSINPYFQIAQTIFRDQKVSLETILEPEKRKTESGDKLSSD